MTVECFTKSKKYAPTQKRCHFAGTFTFQIYAYMFLKVFLFQNSFTLQNEDIKDQQGNTRMVKTDRVEKMSHETLADEATRFFGALKTKRTKTIQRWPILCKRKIS